MFVEHHIRSEKKEGDTTIYIMYWYTKAARSFFVIVDELAAQNDVTSAVDRILKMYHAFNLEYNPVIPSCYSGTVK